MLKQIRAVPFLIVMLLALANSPSLAQAPAAVALLQETAKAMGGLAALRALNNQVIESDGKQFDSSSTNQPLGPTRQISTFRYTLTRDLRQPKLRLDWDGRSSARNEAIRFVEVIDGPIGMLQEGGASDANKFRLHPGRLVTRLREETRNPAKTCPCRSRTKEFAGPRRCRTGRQAIWHCCPSSRTATSFASTSTGRASCRCKAKFSKTTLSKGDSSYTVRYSDWRKIDSVMLPFSLRYELNGRELQEEQIKSMRNNTALPNDVFAIRNRFAIRNPMSRRSPPNGFCAGVAGNVSYQDLGRAPVIEWMQLAPGVHKIKAARMRRLSLKCAIIWSPSKAPLRSSHRASGAVDQRALSRQTDSLRHPDAPSPRSRRRHPRVHGRRRDPHRAV